MCGRFVQASSPELLVARFGVDEPAAARHEPSYNVAPRATVYAVRDRAGGDGGSADRRRYLSDLRWGLIPSWAKDPRVGDRMINARAESLADKPAYERAFQRDRWLDAGSGDVDALAHLLQPASDDLLVAYPVGTAVNSADNDGPELVERVELEPSLGL